MALKCGFFNSVSGDRLYNADDMSRYFRGLVGNGVLPSIGNCYQVTAAGGLDVTVGTGRALLDSRWAELDAPQTLTISAAHAVMARYTAIVLGVDYTDREIRLYTVDGTPASVPVAPPMNRTETAWELCLALVLVPAGATAITQTQITDTRPDTEVCGYVTGLINQVDTSALFLQWQTAYQEFYQSFQEWFDTLTQELQVNTYLTRFEKLVTGTPAQIANITLDMEGYTFDPSDIFDVYINGLAGHRGTDYEVSAGTVAITIGDSRSASNSVLIKVTKSKIGDPVSGGGSTFEQMEITEGVSSNSTIVVSGEVE